MSQNFRKIDGKALYDIIEYSCMKDKVHFEIGRITKNWINWKTIEINENLHLKRNRIFVHHRIQSNSLKLYTKIPLDYNRNLQKLGITLEDSHTTNGWSIFESYYHCKSKKDVQKALYVVDLALKMHSSN